MPNKVGKFKVCINCDGCIPVIPESNFYEIEKSFDKQHKNHMTTILTGEEMRAYLKRRAIMSKLCDNARKLRSIRWYDNNVNSTEHKLFIDIRNNNKQLLKQLKEI